MRMIRLLDCLRLPRAAARSSARSIAQPDHASILASLQVVDHAWASPLLVALLLGVLLGGLAIVRRAWSCRCVAACARASQRRRIPPTDCPEPDRMEFINEWFWFFLLLPIAARQRLGDRPPRRRTP